MKIYKFLPEHYFTDEQGSNITSRIFSYILANLKRKGRHFENIKGDYQMSNECHGNRFKFFNTMGLIEFI